MIEFFLSFFLSLVRFKDSTQEIMDFFFGGMNAIIVMCVARMSGKEIHKSEKKEADMRVAKRQTGELQRECL